MLMAKGSELTLLGWDLGVGYGDVGECEQWMSPSLCPHHPHVIHEGCQAPPLIFLSVPLT